MASEEILGEFVPSVAIAENSCIVEPPAELADDRIRLIFDVEILCLDQRNRRLNHRTVSKRIGLRIVFVLEMDLRFEHQSLGISEIELRDRNHFTRALAYTHIADCEFPRITPIGIESTILFVSRNFHERLDHLAAFLLSDTLDEILKDLCALAVPNVSACDRLDHIRNLLRRNGADCKSVGTGVVLPFS